MINFTETELRYIKERFDYLINIDIHEKDNELREFLLDQQAEEKENIIYLFEHWTEINSNEEINKKFTDSVWNVLGFYAWDQSFIGGCRFDREEVAEYIKDKIFLDLYEKICCIEEEIISL